MTARDSQWQHEFMVSNGIRLHYVTAGSGPLMLMLHGFPEFWYSWRYQIPVFAQHYRVVALDLRGYNDSDKPPETSAYVMDELLKDVVGVIRGLGYNHCILVGHDWGGAIAWYLAEAYPDLVERLIVMNIPHPAKFLEGLRSPQQLLRSWYIFGFQLPFLPEWGFQWNNYQAIANAFVNMAVNKQTFSPADLEAYKNAAAKPGALTSAINYYRNAIPSFLRFKTWNVLEIPTLMIWGEQDTALGKELTYGTEAYVKNLTLHYIPNCSHWVQQEQPELVNQYMSEFLAINC